MIIEAALGSLFKSLADLIREIWGDAVTAQQNHDLGASRAEAQGKAVVQEIGNDQSARPSQYIDPDDDDALARILREHEDPKAT